MAADDKDAITGGILHRCAEWDGSPDGWRQSSEPLCHTRFVQRRRLGSVATVVGFAVTTLSACGEATPVPDAAAFCEELRNNRSAIIEARIDTDLELTATLELYRRLQTLAPLAVAQEWSNVLQAIETANTVVPSDPDSIQRIAAAAYQSESSALTIHEWAMASCDVDLGPVTTLVPHDPPEPATPVGAAD